MPIWNPSKLVWISLLFFFILFSSCGYEKEPSEWEQFSRGVEAPDGSGIIYGRWYQRFRKPRGLNRFPDGGRPKILEKDFSLYFHNYSKNSGVKISSIEGKPGNPPSIHFSWKGDTLVYWLNSSFNKNYVPPVSWSRNSGIFSVGISHEADGVTLQHEQLLDCGEMPELSPDSRKMAFLKRAGENAHELWVMHMDTGATRMIQDLRDLHINWIEWIEENNILLYSSVSEKKVYKLTISTLELSLAKRAYRSYPLQIKRGTVKELHQ